MDSIASLKESKGSAPNRIQDHVVSGRRNPLKNARFQITKALSTGLKTGLLREVSGKYKLGLDPRDYALCSLGKNIGGVLPVEETKRSRNRHPKRRRSRGRHDRRRRRDWDPVMICLIGYMIVRG
ncbi:hypothetical protein JTB14_015871 [Gonioctena quinquepunctata]|nr:hypothetical protein JTB14_015871 [Gonioctena quinquepunctata]